MVQWSLTSILLLDQLSNFSLQPVLHNWSYKGHVWSSMGSGGAGGIAT